MAAGKTGHWESHNFDFRFVFELHCINIIIFIIVIVMIIPIITVIMKINIEYCN